MLKNKIALFDVIKSCDICGSSDSSIKNVVPNDLAPILSVAEIDRVFTNGALAHKLYNKYLFEKTGISDTYLPSTSPANAAFSLEKLIKEWQIINITDKT